MTTRLQLLDETWCERVVQAGQVAAPALRDVGVEVQCSGAPTGFARFGIAIEGGRIASIALGAKKDAELVLKCSWNDVVAMWCGDLDPSAAFMTGAIKTDGPTGPLLSMLAAWDHPDVEAARVALRALTDLPD